MERLRSVARAGEASPGLLAREAAAALAGLGPDPAGLVIACRRLVDRRPSAGPLWWLASRVLCAPDPVAEAWVSADLLEEDTTPAALAAALPDEAAAVVVGWPEQAAEGLRQRGDAAVLVVSSDGASAGLARWLRRTGVDADDVPDAGLGAAVAGADLVVLEADAAGPRSFLAAAGSRAAASVARSAGVPVWLVAGVGRTLPGRLWSAIEVRLGASATPAWDRSDEIVPLDLCDMVVGPGGLRQPFADEAPLDCPVALELLKGPV